MSSAGRSFYIALVITHELESDNRSGMFGKPAFMYRKSTFFSHRRVHGSDPR